MGQVKELLHNHADTIIKALDLADFRKDPKAYTYIHEQIQDWIMDHAQLEDLLFPRQLADNYRVYLETFSRHSPRPPKYVTNPDKKPLRSLCSGIIEQDGQHIIWKVFSSLGLEIAGGSIPITEARSGLSIFSDTIISEIDKQE